MLKMTSFTRLRLAFAFFSTLILLGGCFTSDKPQLFANPSKIMSSGYWHACVTMGAEHQGYYACSTWKIRAEDDGRVVAYSRATSKGKPDDMKEFQATALGSELYMFQLLKRKDASLNGAPEFSAYGFVRKHHGELDAVMPSCSTEVFVPVLAAMGLKPTTKPCASASYGMRDYTENEIASFMRAHAAMENVPVFFRVRLSKLNEKMGAKMWEEEKAR